MNTKGNIKFFNQVTGYLFIDVINTFAGDHNCTLYTGLVDEVYTPLQPNVKKVFLTRYNRATTTKRLYTWSAFTFRALFHLLLTKASTQLFIVTNPPFMTIWGYLMHKMKGTKYHLLVYDIYPDILVNMNYIKEKGFIDKLWSRLNYLVFKNAATIYTLSTHMQELIKSYNPNIVVNVIYNWTDTSFIKPIKKADNQFAHIHAQTDKITVMYSGNMGTTHAVEKIVDMAVALKDNPAFGFLAIGDGAKKKLIGKAKEDLELHNLIVLPYQPQETLPFSLTCADIGIVTLASGAEDLSVPSKTYNLLAAGVALLVISFPNSELARLVKKYDCGVCFEPGDTDGMVNFLLAMKNDPERLRQLKENARAASYNFTSANADQYRLVLNNNKP